MELVTWLIASIIMLISYYFIRRKRRRLPPGLPRIPVLGSIPWILGKNKHLIEIVAGDRREYGDISSHDLGSFVVVFLNEPKLIRDALNMEELAGRPHFGTDLKSWGIPLGLIDPDIGPVWREQKRFILKCLRDQGFGRKSEESVQEEAKHLVSHILDHTKSGEDFLIHGVFNIPVINVLWKMVANKTFQWDSPDGLRFIELMEEAFSTRVTRLVNIPVIGRWLAKDDLKRRKSLWGELRDALMESIEEHEASLDEQEPRDLIDNYLLEIKRGRPDFDKRQLVISIVDLFAAGSETSSTTLRWAVMFLILYPEVQRRCQAELDLLDADYPGLSDMSSLNYCQATILETLRLGCIAPGTLFHKALVDIQLAGYDIPAGTMVCGNFMATHHDPELWSEPSKFKPDRFLDKEGKILKEIPNFFPFSIGKRVCLGENLARVELFIFFTTLVKNCKFNSPKNNQGPDESKYKIGITKIPNGFFCAVTERSEMHS